ncbi:hypothetical protein [Mammaliicoccus sp. Dog046]|uniref:hypothetical protein n=1 Tax=Mammaliicoccus sp. Dog046 TaxID=3034233 RepID=UPI002B262382|nr:hypothetical protein [Mammaliicoccus sp. Dog046]WQK85414.1 hypothetical protein P3U32_12530 [Mammaliicoccus sp. Dog046]
MTNKNHDTKLSIDRIIFIGRTYEEYLSMFNLRVEELKNKKILDCPAGACSFAATAKQKGIEVEACDIAYYFEQEALYEKGKDDVTHMVEKMKNAASNYQWNYFKDIENLKQYRLEALNTCVADMERTRQI